MASIHSNKQKPLDLTKPDDQTMNLLSAKIMSLVLFANENNEKNHTVYTKAQKSIFISILQ